MCGFGLIMFSLLVPSLDRNGNFLAKGCTRSQFVPTSGSLSVNRITLCRVGGEVLLVSRELPVLRNRKIQVAPDLINHKVGDRS